MSDLGAPLVELLAPQPGERILDLGCGDGALTLRLLEQGCSVVAVDASAEMVEAARALGWMPAAWMGRRSPSAMNSMRCSPMRRCIGCRIRRP
ncbi:MAG: class I SAM-dependent methyltransferase [Cyanobacteriota bacterium]